MARSRIPVRSEASTPSQSTVQWPSSSSKIPVRSNPHTPSPVATTRRNFLTERNLNQLDAISRPPRKDLDLDRPRTRRARSRTVSSAQGAAAIVETVQRNAVSASPPKQRAANDTPEWRRRLLGRDAPTGNNVDLFSQLHLESVFQPPSDMPSSPPILFKNFQSTPEDLSGVRRSDDTPNHSSHHTASYERFSEISLPFMRRQVSASHHTASNEAFSEVSLPFIRRHVSTSPPSSTTREFFEEGQRVMARLRAPLSEVHEGSQDDVEEQRESTDLQLEQVTRGDLHARAEPITDEDDEIRPEDINDEGTRDEPEHAVVEQDESSAVYVVDEASQNHVQDIMNETKQSSAPQVLDEGNGSSFQRIIDERDQSSVQQIIKEWMHPNPQQVSDELIPPLENHVPHQAAQHHESDYEERQENKNAEVEHEIISPHVSIIRNNTPLSQVSFRLSPLPEEEDRNDSDQSYLVSVSRMGRKNRRRRVKAKEPRCTVGEEKLVSAITDIKPFDPYWNQIKELDLSGKGLQTLDKLDEYCGKLVELNVANNDLTQVIGAPPSIQYLNVANNHLSDLTFWSHLKNLQVLDVSGNELESLAGFQHLIHLRHLKADNCQIKSLKGIEQLRGLQTLSVKGNQLGKLDFKYSKLKELTTLDVRDNKLTDVQYLHCLPALNELNLDHNCLSLLPLSSTTPLLTLRVLKANHNQIATLDINAIPELHVLELDHNCITAIDGLRTSKHLATLSLREQDSPLLHPTTPFDINDCRDLTTLHISGNVIPATGFHPTYTFLNLRHLGMANCGLLSLPSSFATLFPNVRALNLNFNALKTISPLRGIARLRHLLLAGNRLSRLRKTASTLKHLPVLAVVDLRNNLLNVGFYNPTPPSITTTGSAVPPEPFTMPPADSAADAAYRTRLDADTALRRRLYELLLATSRPALSHVDGLVFSAEKATAHDDGWARLVAAGVLRDTAAATAAAVGKVEGEVALGQKGE
ncbi:MAG: hypothetical protein M1833_000918 [Piccolia ochrophora]|nr:MAG: hypothetical protein M1833_000918 [Piccolia ochrophora]